LGASLLVLIVLFVQEWPLWIRLALAPLAVAAEFLWLLLKQTAHLVVTCTASLSSPPVTLMFADAAAA